MTFGDKTRGIRLHMLMPGANRKQVRDRIRAFQRRNDGSWKETRSQYVRPRHTPVEEMPDTSWSTNVPVDDTAA